MKTKKLILLMVCISGVLSSCKMDNPQGIDNTAGETNVLTQSLSSVAIEDTLMINAIRFGGPRAVPEDLFELENTGLAVLNKYKTDDSGILTIFDDQSNQVLGTYFPVGDGPGEFLRRPVFIDQGVIKEGELFHFYSFPRTTSYALQANWTNSRLRFAIDTFPAPDYYEGAQSIFPLRDSLFAVLLPNNNLGKVGYWNRFLGHQEYMDFVPVLPIDLPRNFYTSFYNGPVARKPDGSTFVFHSNYFNVVDIYAANGEVNYLTIQEDDDQIIQPDFMNGEPTPPNLKIHYIDFAVSEDWFCGLWIGMSPNDFEEHLIGLEEGVRSRPVMQLHFFDWNGKLLHRYMLDAPVSKIATGTDNRLWAITFLNEEYSIGYFTLPE